MRLVEFSSINKEQYLEYIVEWEIKNQVIIPGASDRNGRTFEEMLQKWNEDTSDETYKKGFVPSTLFFLINDKNCIVGAIHLRHDLNNKLLQAGGNIGYGIKPSERNKGYGVLMLKLLLEKIKNGKYERVLLTCDDENIPSIKTIENNMGLLENIIMYEGKLKRRYWIDIRNAEQLR